MQISRADIHDLYDRYGHVVFHRCRSILGDEQEARDAMQEVFVKLMRNAGQLRGEASPVTWLYRVSTNHCLNRIRDRKARARKLAEPDPGADQLPGMAAFADIDPERRRLVQSLLERVDDETRAVVVYYFVDEMTLEEIAELADLSVPTVRKRIQHFQGVARRTLSLNPATVALLLAIGLPGLSAAPPVFWPGAPDAPPVFWLGTPDAPPACDCAPLHPTVLTRAGLVAPTSGCRPATVTLMRAL